MKGTKRTLFIFVIILLLTAGFVFAAEEQPLKNVDIIQLTKMSMGDQVIITKIKTAKYIKFDTSTDDLVKLKKSGVSEPVITAMLERSASGAVSETGTTKSSVTSKIALVAKEGSFDLKPVSGQFKTLVAPFAGVRRFVEFPAHAAATRIKDHFPSLLLTVNADPHSAIWLVKLSRWQDNKVLVLDLPSPGSWGGTISDEPDADYNIPYSAIEEEPGLWRITPQMKLKPGDYGLFRWTGQNTASLYGGSTSLLIGFGIEK